MSRRKPNKIHVRLGDHAEVRWRERAGRSPGKLVKLLEALLIDQIRIGLIVNRGRAVLSMNAEDLGLPQDLIACIDLPDYRGVWRVVTFIPNEQNQRGEYPDKQR